MQVPKYDKHVGIRFQKSLWAEGWKAALQEGFFSAFQKVSPAHRRGLLLRKRTYISHLCLCVPKEYTKAAGGRVLFSCLFSTWFATQARSRRPGQETTEARQELLIHEIPDASTC